ncbi:MAG TPA: hypothetical protein VGO58_02925 [Chitinophagaceae bacterium]|nr:hypothetical protein [Chitinophagaceae bacterium]
MKKLILSATLVVAGFIGINAQAPDGFQFGAGIRAALPVGDMSESQSFGVGAEVQGEYGFSEKFSGVVTSGYTQFFGKKVTILGVEVDFDGVGYVPFLAGIRYYAGSSFFIGAQAGYGLFMANGNSEGAFNYQPQVGYNGSNFQVALNYNALSKNGSTNSHIGLTGIFKFGGGGESKK